MVFLNYTNCIETLQDREDEKKENNSFNQQYFKNKAEVKNKGQTIAE